MSFSPVIPATYTKKYKLAASANQNDAAFPTRIPTTTKPADVGVFDLAALGQILSGAALNNLMLIPFGTGANNTTFSLRLIGWRRVHTDSSSGPTDLWIPVPLVELACTIGTAAGVAGTSVPATCNFADTITSPPTLGNANVDCAIVSPADNTIAHAIIDAKGCELGELLVKTGNSATDANALIAGL